MLPERSPAIDKAADVIHGAAAGAIDAGGSREARIVAHPGRDTLLTGVPLDVVFPVLHGPYGEDGTVQGLLELANVPYVGAGVLASAVGMDKAAMKLVFAAKGLRICDYEVVLKRDWQRDERAVMQAVTARLGFPVFVKPANLGASVGISKAKHAAELDAERTAEVRALGIAAFKAIDGAGMARVDFLLAGDSQVLYLNEVNTIPGFTTISMYAKMWDASGLPYARLIDRLIALAIDRHAEKQQLRTSM